MKTPAEAGQQITRDDLTWGTELGHAATVSYGFRESAPSYNSASHNQQGTFTPLSAADIDDVAAVQGHIGGELASRAARHITAEQLRELELIQKQLEEAYAADDHERAVRLNHEFHRGVNLAADSPKLAQLMSQITRYALESVFPTVEGWPKQSTRDHRRVLAALQKRDGELARTAMSRHLCAGSKPLIDHLHSMGVVED